jgi:large conductance mechanosensitive channel
VTGRVFNAPHLLGGHVAGFKKFLLQGNLVDVAVGIVIGVAFGALVTGLVKDLITPLIAAIGGQPDFSSLTFTINNSKFLYGDFINLTISFVLIALVVWFLIVSPFSAFKARFTPAPAVEPKTKDCPYCLSAIPVAATRCAFCTSDLGAAKA